MSPVRSPQTQEDYRAKTMSFNKIGIIIKSTTLSGGLTG